MRWPFGGLSWRLAVSYFWVTLLAALTIEAAFVIGPILTQQRDPNVGRPLIQIMLMRNEQISAYLRNTTVPDQYYLQSQVLDPLLGEIKNHTKGGEYGVVALLDTRQQVVASAFTVLVSDAKLVRPVGAGSGSGTLPRITDLLATTSSQAVIQSALTAAQDVRLLKSTSTGPDGYTTIAVPLQSGDRQVVGVLVMLFQGNEVGIASSDGNLADFWQMFLAHLQPAGFYFLMLATVVGTATGLVISRNLSLRLRRMTVAASAWSQGEFQVEVRDLTRDELGQLGRDLNRMAEQLRSLLATRQGLAVLEERNRLARELHDSVKQHIFANALLVRAARKLFDRDPVKAQVALVEAEELAHQAQQELVALIQALRPATLANKGLVVALQELSDDWSRRMGIAVQVRAQSERVTPMATEDALFRVTQEALTNVARHSEARRVEIQLVWMAEQITLTLTDDGKGFNLSQVDGKGLGLGYMRERITALDGALTIASTTHGTVIEISVPLPNTTANEEQTYDA